MRRVIVEERRASLGASAVGVNRLLALDLVFGDEAKKYKKKYK